MPKYQSKFASGEVVDELLSKIPDLEEASDGFTKQLTVIEQEIADLKYEEISIVSFSHNAGTKENGDTASSVVLSWALNKEPASLTVGGETVTAAQSGSHTLDESFTSTTTWNIKATDERSATAEKSTTLYFYDGVYYGTAEKPFAIDSTFILGLTKKLSAGKNLTVSVTGGDGLYFFYAYPASLGTSKFNIGGFDYEYEKQTVAFTNKFDVTKDYYVYVSGQVIPDSISVTVKEG